MHFLFQKLSLFIAHYFVSYKHKAILSKTTYSFQAAIRN